MWIVRLALRRPTDFFPYINIPVAGVIWSYSGMSPYYMAKRVPPGYPRR
jgi:multidrug efflux pump subunit AcrB